MSVLYCGYEGRACESTSRRKNLRTDFAAQDAAPGVILLLGGLAGCTGWHMSRLQRRRKHVSTVGAGCRPAGHSLASVSTWDELRMILTRLRDEQPGALQAFPNPSRQDGQPPPYQITLAPTAVAVAEELHTRFGHSVELTVGALPYPPGRPPRWPPITEPPAQPLSPQQATVELDGPAVVRTGHTLRHALLLHNLSGGHLEIPTTNGQLTTAVVDPATGAVVGGFAGAQALALITYRVAPGQTGQIPLLTGTASFTPRLGYAVPAGSWGLQATLTLGKDPRDAPRRRTPVLPLTITP